MKAAEQAEAQRQVDEFNHRHPVGALVFAYPGCRPEDGAGTRLVTRTRTEAQLSASGDPVVWVEGEGAYICLTHVDPVAEDVWEAAREAEKQAEPETPSVPARLSSEREAEIFARHEAATPGPWSANAQIGVVTNEAGDPLAVFGGGEQDRADAAFVAAAREDVPELLAELAAVRAERDQAKERVAELERPEIEAMRNKVRDSYAELIAQCEKDRDYEGAFEVQCRLADREAQWRREDEAAS
ncbi:hypothetical protein GTY88_03160 [Streptomyces sp. SID5926]|nr:hypothetical protein [Streptomyces sp. SID5926]